MEFNQVSADFLDGIAILEADSYPPDEAASSESISYRFNVARKYFFQLTENNQLIGFINGTCVKEDNVVHSSMSTHCSDGKTLVVHSVTVDSRYRRKGIASAMLKQYISEMAKKKELNRILLLSKAYLIQFYMNAGFKVVCESHVEHGQETWFEMGLDLREFGGLKQWHVDAFSSVPFKGNPAAVIEFRQIPSSSEMTSIAKENNIAVTAFVAKTTDGDGYDIRWFAPSKELPLCGHGTLAAAHVLFHEIPSIQGENAVISFKNKEDKVLRARKDSTGGKISLTFPAAVLTSVDIGVEIFRAALEALGLYSEDVLITGEVDHDSLLLQLSVSAFMTKLQNIDFSTLILLEYHRIIVTCIGKKRAAAEWEGIPGVEAVPETDFVSRCFLPNVGINEDQVTGTAHCVLAPFWTAMLQESDGASLTGFQASERTGLVTVKWNKEEDTVELGGSCYTVKKETVFL